MIVCVCHRVSDRDIRRHAQQGCNSFDDVQMACGVSGSCGRCEPCAREVFADALAARQGHIPLIRNASDEHGQAPIKP